MTPPTFLVVATPCYGGLITSLYGSSMLKLQAACQTRGLRIAWLFGYNDSLITRARAEIVRQFLDMPDATHLLFVDADIGFDEKQVFRLLDFDTDFAAAAYPAKGIDWDKLRRVLEARAPKPESTALNYVLGVDDVTIVEGRDGFLKVQAVGSGFSLIRRAALLRICEAHPELRYRSVHVNASAPESANRFALFECMIDSKTGAYLSEDFAFCRRWTDLGGEIWVDLSSELTHIGPMAFVGDLRTQFRARGTPAAR